MNRDVLLTMLRDAGFPYSPDLMNKLPKFEKLIRLDRELCAQKLEDDCWLVAAHLIRESHDA